MWLACLWRCHSCSSPLSSPSPCVCLGFFGKSTNKVSMGLVLQVCPCQKCFGYVLHAGVHCGKEWKWRTTSAGVEWECVPERSAAVARSQMLPWEAENPVHHQLMRLRLWQLLPEPLLLAPWEVLSSFPCLRAAPRGYVSWAVLTSNSLLCINFYIFGSGGWLF